MQISRNLVNGSKSNNCVSVGIWVIVCVQKPSHHFLQTFRPPRMQIVFGDSSLYPKQLHSFCLLMLIRASADPIGFITNFCSMNCCSSSKRAIANIEAFSHLIMSQQGKRKSKFAGLLYIIKKTKVLLRTWYSFSILVWFRKIRSCKPGCAPASQTAHFIRSTARIRQYICAAPFSSCKLLWRIDECFTPMF